MSEDRPSSRDLDSDQVPCARCHELKDIMDLDRLLWCDRCRRLARNRARWWGWLIGLLFAAGIAAYIWLGIHGSRALIGGWIATVVAALWLGSKVGREIAYGAIRYRNTKGVETLPPSPKPGASGGATGPS
jgi:hypothetical protein